MSDGARWFGTGAAATQCEGAAPRSDWAGWEAEGRAPASLVGNGFRADHAQHLAAVAAAGLTRYRLTIEWARLEPFPGRWDATEVDHLVRVLDGARAAGVEVWANLLHGSAPGWFTDDQRGWLDDKAARLTWPRHVDRVAEAVGHLVAGWIPVHDPGLQARLGYLDGTFPPGRHRDEDHHDAREALLAAEREAARLLGSGQPPVAVTARPGEVHDGDELLAVTAPFADLARALEATTEAAPHAELVVVTGDPVADDPDRRAARLRDAVGLIGAVPGITGAFVLPALDGYEWHRGFEPRLGLLDPDRRPRPGLEAL